jgi:hypothetical protein
MYGITIRIMDIIYRSVFYLNQRFGKMQVDE